MDNTSRWTAEEVVQMVASVPDPLSDKLREDGYGLLINIPGRGICGVQRFAYTSAIVIGIDETGYRGRYCYHTYNECGLALIKWVLETNAQGDPPGEWIKYKGYGGERSRIDDSSRN